MQFQKLTLFILLIAGNVYGLEVLEAEKNLPTAKMEEVLKQQQVIGKKPEAIRYYDLYNQPSLPKQVQADYQRRMSQGTLPKATVPSHAYGPLKIETPSVTLSLYAQKRYDDEFAANEMQLKQVTSQKNIATYNQTQLEQKIEAIQARLIELQKQKSANPSQEAAIDQEMQTLRAQAQILDAQQGPVKTALDTLTAQEAELNTKAASINERYTLEPQITGLTTATNKLKNDVINDAYLLETYQSRFKQVEKSFGDGYRKSQQLHATIDNYEQQIGTLKKQLNGIADKTSADAQKITQTISTLRNEGQALIDQYRGLQNPRTQYEKALQALENARSNYNLSRAQYIQAKGKLDSLKAAHIPVAKGSEAIKQKGLASLHEQSIAEMGPAMHQEMLTIKEIVAKAEQDPLYKYKSDAAERAQLLDHPEQISLLFKKINTSPALKDAIINIFYLKATLEELEKAGTISKRQAAELAKIRVFSDAWNAKEMGELEGWENIGVSGV